MQGWSSTFIANCPTLQQNNKKINTLIYNSHIINCNQCIQWALFTSLCFFVATGCIHKSLLKGGGGGRKGLEGAKSPLNTPMCATPMHL